MPFSYPIWGNLYLVSAERALRFNIGVTGDGMPMEGLLAWARLPGGVVLSAYGLRPKPTYAATR